MPGPEAVANGGDDATSLDSGGMKALPSAARLYVVSVIALGAIVAAARIPDAQLADPYLFVSLLLIAALTSAF